MQVITGMSRCLWAKKAKDGRLCWLPLLIHLADSAQVARLLWRDWVPEGVKGAISGGLTASPAAGGTSLDTEDLAQQLFIFLAAAHDLGKATPVFQSKLAGGYLPNLLDAWILDAQAAVGMPMPASNQNAFASPGRTPHALATQLLLVRAGCNRQAAAVLGAHHGKPPSTDMADAQSIDAWAMNYHMGAAGRNAWSDVQQEVLSFCLDISGCSSLGSLGVPNMAAQVLLCGLVIMTDWIASNGQYFPYIQAHEHWEEMLEPARMQERAQKGLDALNLTRPWNAGSEWMYSDLYPRRFSTASKRFEPRLMQQAVARIAGCAEEPGILVIEAAMGQGKTEAALAAAEIFAFKENRSGLFFALPTQATSDGVFPRIERWARHLDADDEHSIQLAHSKAQFNGRFQSIMQGPTTVEGLSEDEGSDLIVHQWFEGSKKALLADFVVGTVDQLLMAALKQKHVMLRHLGLAGKVIIIDECHAYDAYMSQYLGRVLSWLGAYKVPVIVLSATLPAARRRMVVEAYLNRSADAAEQRDTPMWAKSRGYPLITWTDAQEVKQEVIPASEGSQKIHIGAVSFSQIEDKLSEMLSEGGCIGLILNTVRRAQLAAQRLRIRFGEDAVRLFHSQFISSDRAAKEQELLSELGTPDQCIARPRLRIAVGTQVLEQSLDIDFDLLITDLCPMDLLLQRIGRLHRHPRNRPEKLREATCLIIDLDDKQNEPGAVAIYGEYLLVRTKALLPAQLSLPGDIPRLVQDVYDDTLDLAGGTPAYAEAAARHWHLMADKRRRAEAYRIDPIWPDDPMQWLVGWLDTDVSDREGDAAVRDSDESIEVLLAQRRPDGHLHFLPWTEGGQRIHLDGQVDSSTAQALARQSIRLPSVFSKPGNTQRTISQLEEINGGALRGLQQSPWLRGSSILLVDESLSAGLAGYRLHYDQALGMTYEKEDQVDARNGV
ncbi:MAG: CRISPR-associated helicase Cas3' [Christensenellales bacterium]